MLNMIHEYDPTQGGPEFNMEFMRSLNDTPITELVIKYMRETEAIENIEILDVRTIMDPDNIDINEHSININYKRKTGAPEIPKYKYIYTNRVGEMIFTIKVKTNLHERVIIKKILIPVEYDGFYYLNNKKWKAAWQIVDKSTYNQRGRITLKSRMPIIMYQTKHRPIIDMDGTIHEVTTFSYAQNSKPRRGMSKARVKFINPMMIYAAKIGVVRAIDFMCVGSDIRIVPRTQAEDGSFRTGKHADKYYFFNINEVVFQVRRSMMDSNKLVAAVVGMLKNLESNEFPVTYDILADLHEERDYWYCRIGYIGSIRSKNLYTFLEKGRTSIYMIERLLDAVTRDGLRLEECYKHDIYCLMRWMMMEFDTLKSRSNMDLDNKRIRKNEYIVASSLGKKIAENINKVTEKMSKSKQNLIETLLEVFNFPSDIIISGMRNNGDLVKSDELVNDFTALQDMFYSSKGPNSLGEQSSKMISQKYRNIHPSYIGRIDINVSSNSDVGMSGAFTPFVELYDNFFFTPEGEPCHAMYELYTSQRTHYELDGADDMVCFNEVMDFANYEEFSKFMQDHIQFPGMEPEPIRIVEKEPEVAPEAAKILQMTEEERLKAIAEATEADNNGEGELVTSQDETEETSDESDGSETTESED